VCGEILSPGERKVHAGACWRKHKTGCRKPAALGAGPELYAGRVGGKSGRTSAAGTRRRTPSTWVSGNSRGTPGRPGCRRTRPPWPAAHAGRRRTPRAPAPRTRRPRAERATRQHDHVEPDLRVDGSTASPMVQPRSRGERLGPREVQQPRDVMHERAAPGRLVGLHRAVDELQHRHNRRAVNRAGGFTEPGEPLRELERGDVHASSFRRLAGRRPRRCVGAELRHIGPTAFRSAPGGRAARRRRPMPPRMTTIVITLPSVTVGQIGIYAAPGFCSRVSASREARSAPSSSP
jgi:hypothetical protein